jgi:accessory gene regulator B
MIRRWAEQLAVYLQTELDLEPARLKVLAYGLEAVLGGLVQLIILAILPLLLGIGPATWMAAGTATLFRLPAGGAHCAAFDRCLISSLSTFMLAGTAGILLARQISFHLFPFVLTVLCVAVLAVLLYVPADTPARPVVSRREKQRLKAWAFFVLGFYLLLYLSYGNSVSPVLVVAGGLGLLIQTFTILPCGYRALAAVDRFLAAVLEISTRRGEVRL